MKIFLILSIFYFSLFGFSLEEVEQRAKNNNIDISIQKNELLGANSNIKAKKAKRYGEVELFATYSQYNSPRTLKPLAPPISTTVATSEEIANYGASYSVVLFNGFSDAKDINIAQIQNEVQNSKLTLTFNQILYNVRSLYLDILALKNQKEALIEYEKALVQLEENIAKEVDIGKRAKVDLLKVKADLQNTSSEVNYIQSNIDILKSSLGVLISYEDNFELEDIVHYKNKEILDSTDYDKKIENLSSYKLSKLNQQKNINEYKKIKAAYYPKVIANTQYTKVSSTHGDDDEIWQATLLINWKIFDFGKTNALVEQAKIQKIKSLLELKKSKLELKHKITQAINQIKQNEEAYLKSTKEFSFTQETQNIEKVRYEQEAIDIYKYLYAKGANELVKAKMILAKYNLLKSYYYFEYILEESK